MPHLSCLAGTSPSLVMINGSTSSVPLPVSMTFSMALSGVPARPSRPAWLLSLVTLIIGVVVGSVSAYYGGAVDNVIMRIVDIFLILPYIMAALILAAILTPRIGKSLIPAMTALIAFGWMGICAYRAR